MCQIVFLGLGRREGSAQLSAFIAQDAASRPTSAAPSALGRCSWPLSSREFPWGEVRAGRIDSLVLGLFPDSSGRFSRAETPQSSDAKRAPWSLAIFQAKPQIIHRRPGKLFPEKLSAGGGSVWLAGGLLGAHMAEESLCGHQRWGSEL